jgi:formylglycine-generating enzyme required for sulfatase activity
MTRKKHIQIGLLEFLEFDPGTFTMGDLDDDEDKLQLEIRRKIKLTSSFYLQTTPLSVGQYKQFINETGYESDYRIEVWDNSWVLGPYFWEINGRGNDYPVVGVSFVDVCQYIDWASQKYNVCFRLPTEAEFEYAAKLGCTCDNYCEQALEAKARQIVRQEGKKPVDGCLPLDRALINTSGLIGMNGALWQWCSDWFYDYDPNETIDPCGPRKEPEHILWNNEKISLCKVIRGGSFSYPYYHSRCSNRHCSKIHDRNYNLGFRVCL